jgi:replicative superfamily II helicase
MTPEMFNSKCRYYKNHEWLQNANIILDESHIIGSISRGDKIEIGLIQYYENYKDARTLFISATIPNVNDFAKFIENNTKKDTIAIKSLYRPCQLIENFVPFHDTFSAGRMSYEQKEAARLEKVMELVHKNKHDSTIVFVGAKEFGRKLSERLNIYSIKHYFHNADLDRESRNKIENEFRNGDFNVLIATTGYSWGVNSPAKHVVISHTAYGLTPMDPADIHQAKGRAGRYGYSDKGEAHILVPKKDLAKEKIRLGGDYEIQSTLNDINTMIFHILSYVDNGDIKNADELFYWHEKTLASIQKSRYGVEKFSLRTAEEVLENLESRKMIKKDEEGNYVTTEMGQVTARMYMSPLDVSDWFSNFSKIKYINPFSKLSSVDIDKINTNVAICFAKCFSWSNPAKVYISKSEQSADNILEFAQKLINSGKFSLESVLKTPYVKYASIFYSLLKGDSIDPRLQSITYNLQQDLPRVITTLKQVDERYGKYQKTNGVCNGFGWGNEWDKLGYRLRYPGISEHLWDLVSIDGIGQVLAQKLHNSGIKSKKDFETTSNHMKIKEVIGEKRAEKIFSDMSITSSGEKVKKVKKVTKKEKEVDSLF